MPRHYTCSYDNFIHFVAIGELISKAYEYTLHSKKTVNASSKDN